MPCTDKRARLPRNERGQVLVLLALGAVVLIGLVALAVDVGKLLWARTSLQAAADASALASVQSLPDEIQVRLVAQEYAALNHPGGGDLVLDDDVVVGNWDATTATFTPNLDPRNAVEVTVRRLENRGNALPLLFASVLGREQADVQATAIATGITSGAGIRFLVDEDMVDSDIGVIEDMADEIGMDPEDLITARDKNSVDGWFLELMYQFPGREIWLPTGQVGDEGLYDVEHPNFPFTESSDPSVADFINYNEAGPDWRYELVPKDMLDPLQGVSPISDPDEYHRFVDPEFCQVSPIYKSDISPISTADDGTPQVNALGERRGALAFRVLEVGPDPSGSVLPQIRIQLCSADDIDLSSVTLGGGPRYQLVR